LLDSGKVSTEDVYPQFILDRLAAGVAFEDAILDDIAIVPSSVSLETFDAVFGIPVQENSELLLFGQPDGISTKTCAPIEIKHHQRVTPLDKLELSFYWTLLEPQRRRKTVSPHGFVQLRAPDGSAREFEYVELLPSHFAEVEELILGVREARQSGVEADVCNCFVCRSRVEVAQCIAERQSVRLLFGVNRKYTNVLEQMKVGSIPVLAGIEDPVLLADQMHRKGSPSISPLHVVRWHHHARAFVENRPVRFLDERFEEPNYIVLDLEYDEEAIWLIGLLIHIDGQDQVTQLWCDSVRELRAALKKVVALLKSHPGLSVLTYNGSIADIPQFRVADGAFGLDIENLLASRHVDLYQLISRTVRFPIGQHGLKDVCGHLEHKRQSPVVDGHDVLSLLEDYRSARKLSTRQQIKADIIQYNREDLEACVVLAEFLRTLELHPDASLLHRMVVDICAERKREAKRRQEKRRYRERRAGKSEGHLALDGRL
jgi:predicted RecB family nuclease